MNNQDELKKMAAKAAIDYIKEGMLIGVGSGTTIAFFIEALANKNVLIKGAVASSRATAQLLLDHQFEVIDPNTVTEIPIYVDGADEINQHLQMIKGGGGALTGEKIIATMSRQFLCMADETKRVNMLGKHPIALEVIPMARSYVAREIVKLGGDPIYRQGFISDYGNLILDVYHLELLDPIDWEIRLNNIPGVVTNGIFASRPADILLLARENGVETISKS
jgi:ribose 5-phosphate isomerase A